MQSAIFELRNELARKGEATELFAQERSTDSVEGIIGNIMQSFSGKAQYPTAEEKAAHLLYFMVKNHPFSDGNKRSGAFAFIWFLRKTKIKKTRNINPAALTALTLLVAESSPKDKEQITALITHFIKIRKGKVSKKRKKKVKTTTRAARAKSVALRLEIGSSSAVYFHKNNWGSFPQCITFFFSKELDT